MKQRLYIALFSLFLISHSALALEPVFTGVFSKAAIRGYDTVAYFIQNQAVKGDKQYSAEYMGVDWYFASAENRDLFQQSPEKYAPQYGGYCAYAVSQNSTASIQPDQFTIVEGKLYLNYNKKINNKWLANRDQFIADADGYWPALVGE